MAFFEEPFPEDIANRINQDYAAHERSEVRRILDGLKVDGNWIRLACLRLAAGRLRHLPQFVKLAAQDPRDLQLSVEGAFGGDWQKNYILYDLRGTRSDETSPAMRRQPRS